jgi:hypothetical protein
MNQLSLTKSSVATCVESLSGFQMNVETRLCRRRVYYFLPAHTFRCVPPCLAVNLMSCILLLPRVSAVGVCGYDTLELCGQLSCPFVLQVLIDNENVKNGSFYDDYNILPPRQIKVGLVRCSTPLCPQDVCIVFETLCM